MFKKNKVFWCSWRQCPNPRLSLDHWPLFGNIWCLLDHGSHSQPLPCPQPMARVKNFCKSYMLAWLPSKRQRTACWQGGYQSEPSRFTGGNVKWHSHFRKHLAVLLLTQSYHTFYLLFLLSTWWHFFPFIYNWHIKYHAMFLPLSIAHNVQSCK